MKKFSAFFLLLLLMQLPSLYAQTATATWPLTSSATFAATVSGNVTASSEAVGAAWPTPTYASRTLSVGGSVSTQSLTVNPNSVGTTSATAHANGGYVQFAVTPQTGYSFAVSSIALNMGSGNANSVSTSIEYSLSADFSSPVVVATPGGSTSFPTTNVLYPFSYTTSALTLVSGQTLYLRIYAWHGSTTARLLLLNGLVISGTTASSAPLVTTGTPSSITSNTATANATVVSDGGSAVTERGIVYGTAANPTISDNKIVDAGTGTGSFSAGLSGLQPATTYHVRAYATNGAGTAYGNDVSFSTTAPDPLSVTVTDNGSTVVLSNGIVTATIQKSNANVTSILYKGLELIAGGYNGGQLYWSWNMPNYQNPSNCTYTLTSSPNSNGFNYAEIKLHMSWDGTASTAAMDVDIYYSLTRGTSGLYATGMLTHPAAYPALPGGEWRMAGYPNPMFDWLTVDALRNRKMATSADGSAAVAVSGAPPEVTRFTTGIYNGQYECKYDYSADFGSIDTWGWSSTANNVGLWMTAASKEYYPGGPMKRELMCHLTPVILNMFGGTHYGMGDETSVAAGEDWQKVYGPYLIYCNSVPAGTPDAPNALWADAKAQASAEKAAWPYNWFTNPAFVQESGRGTVTGKLVINEPNNPSSANMWVGVGIPPTGASSTTDFQHWSKNYQFWVKTDVSGNFTIPHVLPGTYNLYAFGPGAAGQLTVSNAATVTAGTTTALGSVVWTPTRTAATVWEIGVPDRNATEYKHGADWWTSNTYPNTHWGKFMDYVDEFPADVNFTIGQSNIATDWNFVQPYDKSVQSTSPAWKVNFNLASAPASGSTAAVYVALAENFSSALILNVNGTNVTSPSTGIIPSSASNAMIRKGIHGAFSEVRFTFPASLLQAGSNQITFTLRVTGGGTSGEVMYDYVRLEADGASLVTLPVKLSSIKGYQKGPGVQVVWTAEAETDINHYVVERSSDGRTFASAGSVKAKGGNGSIGYDWYDPQPFAGSNYYRIKAIENTGKEEYSKVVKVSLSGEATSLAVYPAPFAGNSVVLQLNNLSKGKYLLSLTNVAGQQVWAQSLAHNGGSVAQTLELPQLASGTYHLTLTGDGTKLTRQIVKN